MSFKRIILVVLDSLGVGELPDANDYGDTGSDTLGHAISATTKLPNLASLGLLNLSPGTKKRSERMVRGYFSKMRELSKGKDTTTGHWEMMGLPLKKGLSTFPNGFSDELIHEFKSRNRLRGILGNKPASGTEIIEELGAEHVDTGFPIVYTSADSVFQIAWHEQKFGLDNLYKICETTRKLLDESPYKVGRVIARPFGGEKGKFKRTENRRDFSLKPFGQTALTKLATRASVVGIGKIPYIFDFDGVTQSIEAHNDNEALSSTLTALERFKQPGMIFTNLNDLDMLYGHRRNAKGYGEQLERIDAYIPSIIDRLSSDDLLIITADHGNDPTYRGTDHTREYVPLLTYSPQWKPGTVETRQLPERSTFADVGETILENFQIPGLLSGTSFLSLMK